MRLDRGNSDHPVAAADAATAVEDTVAVAKVEVASEEATRNSHTALGYARRPGKALPGGGCRRAQGRLRPRRLNAERRPHRTNVWAKVWAGLDSNQRRRKASRFTVCPVWPLRYLPVSTTKAFRVDIARTLRLASSLANARDFS